MTLEQIDLVRKSFDALWPFRRKLAEQFYGRFFELAPAEFGVQTAHFAAFGDALIWGLQQQFGPAFTPEMQQAWIVLYDAIQAEMMRAAKTP
jgi:hemoglobin-like flavoprotein